MTAIAPADTVGRIVAKSPQLSRVFEELQIDYCCGGKRPLEDVCREKQIDVGQLVDRLEKASAVRASVPGESWLAAPLWELCEHIERTHHDYLQRELPRLHAIIEKVVKAHAENHPELLQVQAAFAELRAELEPHMMKEECILFPSIRYLEANGKPMRFPFGSLANPIRVMVSDHDHAGDALARIRELTCNYVPPKGACNTYRVMLEGLSTLEHDMHQHVHKENNILFPRAVELEAKIGPPSEAPAVECGCGHNSPKVHLPLMA
jgi:regulator of cell morphogenesis and NO signaling